MTSADTALTRDAGTTTATRITYIVGNAVVAAAAELRAAPAGRGRAIGGLRAATALVADAAWLARLAASCRQNGVDTEAVGRFSTPTTNLDEKGQGTPYGIYSFGAQWSRVLVDLATYQVKVERVVACYDVGRVINPLLLDGQIKGGTVMGLGFGLTEEMVLDKGIMRNPSFAQYLLPGHRRRAADHPGDPGAGRPGGTLRRQGNRRADGGAGRGLAGQRASRAALGVEITELPLTPERLHAAVQRGTGQV